MSKVAIVTGASKGIGAAIALQLAQEGYQLVINYNGNQQKAEAVKVLCEKYQTAIVVQADVAKSDDAKRLCDTAMDTFGRIDVLVNNAGITKDNLLLRMSESDFDDVLSTNLKGTFLMCKNVSKIMMKQRSGSIINISSVVGITGNAGQANYAASKAGIIGLTKSLAKEFASRNIRVNAVAPGFIQSDMTDKLDLEIIANLSAQIPMKRLGDPQDIANTVAFLVSEKSSYLTGQVICVDGGMVM